MVRPSIRQGELVLLPRSIWLVAAALIAWGLTTLNPFVTVMSIGVLLVCIQLLWRPDEPPVLLFACTIQWLQASIAIFYSNYYNLPLDVCFGGLLAEQATFLSLIGVLTLAIGIRVALIHCPRKDQPSAARISPLHAFIAYFVSFIIAGFVDRVAWIIPGLAQIVLAFVSFKWATLFLLFYAVLQRKQGYSFLVTAFVLELGVGVIGYFASFKSVFFILTIALLTSSGRPGTRRLFLVAILTVILTFMGIVWSTIKTEYRDFLNQGTGAQEVLVPLTDRAEKLLTESSSFSEEQFEEGIDAMLLRISYVKFFAMALESVPNDVPFEDGELWLGAVRHIVTPRIFFPDKAPLNDSEITQKYLGIAVAGVEQGTSIGIGYMAESYIDLGPVWMFLPIFCLGLFYGFIYRYFIARKDFRLLGFAAGVALLFPAAQDFAASNVKIVGGVVMSLIIIAIAFKATRKLLPELG